MSGRHRYRRFTFDDTVTMAMVTLIMLAVGVAAMLAVFAVAGAR